MKGPTQIVVNITNRCNLRCRYCFSTSGSVDQNDELSDAEVIVLVSEIEAIKPFNVCFSGGEPLLRKELLFKCIERLSSQGIRTVVVSNGMLIDRETAETLREVGLADLELSLDGSVPAINDRLRGKGTFDKITTALRYLKEVDFPQYEVSMVLTQFNWFDVRSAVELLKSLGTRCLILRPILICGRAQKYKTHLQPTSLQYRKVQYEVNELEQMEKEIAILFKDPLSHVYAFSADTLFFGMEIKANGDLIISPQIQLPLGNVRHHSIVEYWEHGWGSVWHLPVIRSLIDKIEGSSFVTVEEAIEQIGALDLIDDVRISKRAYS